MAYLCTAVQDGLTWPSTRTYEVQINVAEPGCQIMLPLLCSFVNYMCSKCEDYSLSYSFLLQEMIWRRETDVNVEGIYRNGDDIFN